MLSGPVALLGFTCVKYSWCNVIWASGFVGIHMLKRAPNLVLACIEPLKMILLSKLLYSKYHESACVFAKHRDSQNNWRIDSVHWLYCHVSGVTCKYTINTTAILPRLVGRLVTGFQEHSASVSHTLFCCCCLLLLSIRAVVHQSWHRWPLCVTSRHHRTCKAVDLSPRES